MFKLFRKKKIEEEYCPFSMETVITTLDGYAYAVGDIVEITDYKDKVYVGKITLIRKVYGSVQIEIDTSHRFNKGTKTVDTGFAKSIKLFEEEENVKLYDAAKCFVDGLAAGIHNHDDNTEASAADMAKSVVEAAKKEPLEERE